MSRVAIVTRWHSLNRGTLRAIADIALPSGLVLKGCAYHLKDSARRWVSLPAAPQVRRGELVRDGERIKYEPTVDTTDKEAHHRLQAILLEAVDSYRPEDEAV